MIYLKDIKQTVIVKLKNSFPTCNIYGEEIKQGFKAPAFYVEVIPIKTNNALDYKTKQVNIKITYLPLDKTSNAEKNDAVDNFDNIFDLSLKVKDRYFCIQGAYIYPAKDYVQYGFTINFTDEKTGQIIKVNVDNEELTMNEDVEHNYTQENTKLMNNIEFEN